MSVKLLITGGTIDKKYNELNGELIFNQSSIDQMLEQGRSKVDIATEEVMMKDSLEMTDTDRGKILAACLASAESRIVITHGTDTMVETSNVLAANIENKTIVLLGAMIPYQFKNSDALFNLGCAISAVQALPYGIYITMNGKIFPHSDVVKNTSIGEFQKK